MQIRETLEQAGYEYIGVLHKDENIILVRDQETNKLEVYVLNDGYSGHVLVIDGLGYEFVRTADTSDILNVEFPRIDMSDSSLTWLNHKRQEAEKEIKQIDALRDLIKEYHTLLERVDRMVGCFSKEEWEKSPGHDYIQRFLKNQL